MSETEVRREAPGLTLVGFRQGDVPEGAAARRADPGGSGDARATETALRRFILGGPEATEGESASGYVPAALHPWLSRGSVRSDYPLFLALEREEPIVMPVCELVSQAIDRLVEKGGARDPMERVAETLGGSLGSHLAEATGPAVASEVLGAAGRELLAAQPVGEDEREELREAWEALLAEVPPNGYLVDYGEHAALQLLLLAARRRLDERRAAFVEEAQGLASRVRGLLRADAARGDAPDPDGLGGRIGTAAAPRVDPARFANITKHRHRSGGLGAERRQRLEDAAARLESMDWKSEPALVLVHDGTLRAGLVDPADGWRQVTAESPCADAVDVFARDASAYLDLFRAARVAKLELAGRLDPDRHLAAIESLGLDGLHEGELGLLPVAVVVDEQERVSRDGAASLSRLLLSGWPVQLMVTVEPGRVPFLAPGAAHGGRLELAYLGLAHRNAFVQQSASARPAHLVKGFLAALAYPRPGLHVLARGVGGALDAEAALQSRAHPFFRYDPDAGRTWAGRMDFSENPEPDSDWVTRVVPVLGPDEGSGGDPPVESLETRFTFADYALLDTDLDTHFRPIPESFSSEALVPLDEYLQLDGEDRLRRIPFVLGVDSAGCLRRLAITRRLVGVAENCLDFWWTLRELAGVRNAYVEEAVRLARDEAVAEAEAERERVAAAHAQELERAKREAVEQAISNVVRGLLDPESLAANGGEAGVAPVLDTILPAAAEAAEGEAPAPAPAPVRDDPWIESALCTSCNDCTNMNSLLFVYDANKQAKIGDATKGTYAQLVKAAEKCPARCIHPGIPLNSSEKNLEALQKRAEPFR